MLLLFSIWFFGTSLSLDPAELAELQNIRASVSVLNDGDITGMNLEWQSGDLSNACTFLGILCSVDDHVQALVTQFFFLPTGDNQKFAPSLIDYTKFPALANLFIKNRQMVGDFNFKIPSSQLITFTLSGELSTSETGGYTMIGSLPSNLFASANKMEELEIGDLPKLNGNFPNVDGLTTLSVFAVGNVDISGPFPAIPSTLLRIVKIVNTKFSGILPVNYCKTLSEFFSELDPNVLLVSKNPNLSILPNCVKTCSFTTHTLCTITLNNVCDIGQPLANDQFLDPGVFGARQDDCLLDKDNPCTISRDNELCLDCTGEPDSGFTYDFCGVCNKPSDVDRNACLDCLGIPFGTNQYDICGVCMGSANTCFDCFGVAGGSARLDICGVCEGHGATCDCAGVTGGTSVVDDCGVCDGNNACFDCLDVPHGTTKYDLCGVCAGASDTCNDCSGVPAGTKVYDICDVCGGDGSNCDCAGVYLGFSVVDECDICGGDGSTCLDCMGVPNGPAVYDVCDVCNGSDTTDGCENPPDDNSIIQGAERTSTFVFIVIISVLTLICVITVIVLMLNLRRKTPVEQSQRPIITAQIHEEHRNVGGGGGGGMTFNRLNLFVLALALAPIPGNCLLPETTQFFASIATHTDAFTVYPEWFVGSEVRQQCSASTVDLVCVGQDIAEVRLTRPLSGSYGELEQQFTSLLPLATHISVKNSPQLIFRLDGIGNSPLLKDLEILDSGLAGTMPADIENCASMTSLVISNTKLTGNLPEQVGELTLLRNLTISHSELTGVSLVPFDNLNAVTYLDFGSNSMFEMLPPAIGSMENLQELRLANNHFLSILPSEYRDLGNLRILDVSGNALSGANFGLFNGAAGPLQASLEVLMLDHNSFGEELPNLSGYSKLVHIGLSHNFFSLDFSGADGFYYGETNGIVLVMLANHNLFTKLNQFVNQPFYGECNFTFNKLCTDTVGIPDIYFTSQCDLGLRPHDCPPGACGDVSCHDCLGRPNGPSTYDACDVCAGSGTTCLDCNGVPNGPGVYDACHVCGGDSSTCEDCNGVPNGTSFYDGCDVCGGDHTSCADCAGVPFGSSTYDVCDVCNGRGHTCLDCLGVLHGTSKFDECGVCNGDGLSCADPLIIDYLNHRGSFLTFVLLAVLLCILVVVAGILIYLIFSL